MSGQAIELQKQVVVAIARAVPTPWEAIAASYEIDPASPSKAQNLIVVSASNSSEGLATNGLENAPSSISEAFLSLHEASSPLSLDRWTTAEVRIEQDGSYKFSFSYDKPKRLNGIFDYESLEKFENFAEIHAREKSSTQIK